MTKTTLTESQERLEKAMATLEQQTKVTLEQEKALDESGKEKEEPQTVLTVKELKALGSKLSNIIKQISITNYGIDATMMVKEVDPANSVFALKRLMGAIFEQNQFLIEELDTIGFILLMNDSREDIEAEREII